MDDLIPIFIVGFVILGLYKTFELFVKRKERMVMIEKITVLLHNKESIDSIRLPSIVFDKPDYGFWALRIALLLMGVGLGCIVAFFVQYNLWGFDYDIENHFIRNRMKDMQFVLYFAFITIFGGLGLLIAYLIEAKKAKNN